MSEEVKVMTDPLRELAELCTALCSGNQQLKGDVYLSSHFEIDPWSDDFYSILMAISNRIELVKKIIANMQIDEDFKDEMVGHIEQIRSAFSIQALNNVWGSVGATLLSAQNIQPLKALSGLARTQISYKKLSDSDVTELLGEVIQLKEWLCERQLVEHDFIRQLLIDSLATFEFRLKKLKWVGWGYTLESLREVIGAYLMLQSTGINANDNPDATAIILKINSLIKSVYSKIQTAKNATEAADWLLKAYGAASMIYHGTPIVTALLSSP
jgi:hypothetical protein